MKIKVEVACWWDDNSVTSTHHRPVNWSRRSQSVYTNWLWRLECPEDKARIVCASKLFPLLSITRIWQRPSSRSSVFPAAGRSSGAPSFNKNGVTEFAVISVISYSHSNEKDHSEHHSPYEPKKIAGGTWLCIISHTCAQACTLLALANQICYRWAQANYQKQE